MFLSIRTTKRLTTLSSKFLTTLLSKFLATSSFMGYTMSFLTSSELFQIKEIESAAPSRMICCQEAGDSKHHEHSRPGSHHIAQFLNKQEVQSLVTQPWAKHPAIIR
ncbi:hypothetical protein GE061_015455 [Apolygus lucorum]|uniref:Uncharacterized protein n=1 Tax=Apolygus lucorum TaxID=248454 RepID=A0A8S9XNU0_APOLU|nr:hypothetical protein GE061_015455 [Apolygus lucorum]